MSITITPGAAIAKDRDCAPSEQLCFLARHENVGSKFQRHVHETMQAGRKTADWGCCSVRHGGSFRHWTAMHAQ